MRTRCYCSKCEKELYSDGKNVVGIIIKDDEKLLFCLECARDLNNHLTQILKNENEKEVEWYDIPSYEMTLEQARQAVKDLRKILIKVVSK